MKQNGQLQPILVAKIPGDSQQDYLIIDGERRWRASKIAGIKELDVIVVSVKNDEQLFMMSAAANSNRENLTHLELADAIERILISKQMNGMTLAVKMEETAKALGISVPWANQLRRLQHLVPEVKKMLSPLLPDDQRLNITRALMISQLPDNLQLAMAKQAIAEKLSSTQTTRLVQEAIDQHGTGSGRKVRKRQPSDEQKGLERFIEYIDDKGRFFLSPAVQKLLNQLAPDDRKDLVADLKLRIEQLKELARTLEVKSPVKA
jgi:ParB/RepB/Spo0J family partition protein